MGILYADCVCMFINVYCIFHEIYYTIYSSRNQYMYYYIYVYDSAENSCKYLFRWWIPLPFDGGLLPTNVVGIQWLVASFHDIRHVPAGLDGAPVSVASVASWIQTEVKCIEVQQFPCNPEDEAGWSDLES